MPKRSTDKLFMDAWKTCSSCKKEIPYNTTYWICSVSTCNQKRTGWVFCKVECWDAHIPKMSHRECWAEERVSPRAAGASAPASTKPADPVASETSADISGGASEIGRTAPRPNPSSTGPKTIVRRRA